MKLKKDKKTITIAEGIRKQIISEIGKIVNLNSCIIILFGSHAVEKATLSSDIDIAIHCVDEIEDELFLMLEKRLNYYVDTLKHIDIIDLRSTSIEFLEFALKGATIWHVGKDYLESWLKQKKPSRN